MESFLQNRVILGNYTENPRKTRVFLLFLGELEMVFQHILNYPAWISHNIRNILNAITAGSSLYNMDTVQLGFFFVHTVDGGLLPVDSFTAIL